jgi:hypothetical protein
MRIFFALLTAFVSLVLLFGGYRLARFIIPLWGFVAGLSLGGAIYSDMASTPFLGTLLGVTIGVLVGLLFALLAYFYYALAVLVMAGALGYWAGSSFVLFFGFHPGILSTLVGLALGIAVGIGALLINAPKYVLIVLTAVAGAMAAVGSVLLLFNTIHLEDFSYTAINATVSNSFVWSMVALALAVIGIVSQARTTSGFEIEEWGWSEGHGTHGTHHAPPTHTPAGVH